eukprot:1028351-Rhodomonas_salina.1
MDTLPALLSGAVQITMLCATHRDREEGTTPKRQLKSAVLENPIPNRVTDVPPCVYPCDGVTRET